MIASSMKRAIITFGVAIVAFVLGVACTYFLMKTTPAKAATWITVKPVSFGMAFDDKIMEQEWTFPSITGPNGQIKFLDRDKGTQLGYKLFAPIEPMPTAKMPEAYKRVKKLANGWTEGPGEQLEMDGRFRFSLSDADGFLLTRVYGPTEHLYAGSKNEVQSTIEDPIPQSIVDRTRSVEVGFEVDDCNPCKPHLYQ